MAVVEVVVAVAVAAQVPAVLVEGVQALAVLVVPVLVVLVQVPAELVVAVQALAAPVVQVLVVAAQALAVLAAQALVVAQALAVPAVQVLAVAAQVQEVPVVQVPAVRQALAAQRALAVLPIRQTLLARAALSPWAAPMARPPGQSRRPLHRRRRSVRAPRQLQGRSQCGPDAVTQDAPRWERERGAGKARTSHQAFVSAMVKNCETV
ncbi:hypothetical protein [Variovorax rhizosphaerae]|uniref:Uncharacterized protein n=1 Tax=Variovorax rhizosphaerae TaxID=1836200 RepID=A0ABU8WLQ3_9BURK